MGTNKARLGGPLAKRLAATCSLLASVGIMAAAVFPGLLTASAASTNTVDGVGLFELDGNVTQDAATPPPYDWECVFNNPAGHAGCPPPASLMPSSVFQPDYVTPDPTYFAQNKDIQDVSQWGCITQNNPLAKDDILNAYGAAFIVPNTSAYNASKRGHLIVYFGQERASSNGDSFAGFWLMQHSHTCSGSGSFSGGGHDPGDLLVVSNYTNGGGTTTVQLYAWNTSVTDNLQLLGSGLTCGGTGTTDLCGITNTAAFTEPWAPKQSLTPNQFLEEGVDITDLLPMPTTEQGVCFADFLSETRSSQQTTATLKDYTEGQFHFCVTPTVTTQQTAGTTTAAAMTVLAGTPVSDQATLSGLISGTPKGTIDYKLYSTADCSGQPVYDSGALPLVNGVPPPSGTTSQSTVGVYEWRAFYSGDISLGGRNAASASACGDEPLTVVNANIQVTPATATNAVNNQHVFTITVNALAPQGTTVSFGAITTSVQPTPSSQVSTCGTPAVNGFTATCTLTINSTSVTTYTVNASANLTVGGVAITRATNGTMGPGGTGPATKNYVDAFITITPNTADNEVRNEHVFTITLTALPGNATPVSFGAISASVLPTAGLTENVSTCGSPNVNGNVETCTLTINSSTAGTYVANATGAVTIGGALVSRTTAPDGSLAGPGGSGPATKHYVDATISISPNGINPVTQQHVFTVFVQALPGGATPVSFGAITTMVTPTPGTETTTCNAPTLGSDSLGPTAMCTLTIDNGLANTFSATATAHVTMGTVTVTRTTDGQNGNSPPATKIYVDASIGISPSSVNEVGHAHVFTITVTALPSTATPVIFNSITPSVTPTPGTMVSTCGTPNIIGLVATCTVTVDNNTAGVFTVNANAVVTMGGTAVLRSTDVSVAPAGPGGTGPSTKTFVDASVAIGPPTATNAVGAPHTFHVTVTAIPSGATPVSFGTITPVVTPTPSSMSTTCGSPTVVGNVATCTVTIDSTTPGTFLANVTAMVTMGGVTVTRTTAPDGSHAGPGGSGPATKIYSLPFITIAPSAVNEVGHQHVFTITVTSIPGTETTFNSITPHVVPTPDSMVSTCNNPVITNNVATCTVTINSNSAGVFTATATADLTVNGFGISVTTDGVGADSGPAVKTYVDALIGITPATAVNEVGNQHVFTVTVTGLPANQSFSVNSITTSVTPTPDLLNSTTCGSPLVNDNVATCTITINNSTAGTFTANAAAVVTVDGLQLQRSTDGSAGPAGPGGSGPAIKHYVDASVGIGPSAFNEINHQHVFTIVVTALPGGTTPVLFSSITPSVSPQPLSSTNTCNAPTVNGNQATCTLTINNALPDTFQANVVAVVSMGGVSVTRSTSGNAGPGGTGPATKTYVTANIGLSPLVATDPVGDLHTLTATVTTNNGSGEGQPQAAPNGTVVSFTLVSGPGALASPSCTVSNGLGTCTDVLTSNVAGTSVIHACTSVVVDGVTLNRCTNDSVPGDSVDAVKNWHKVQPAIATVQSAGGTLGTAVSDTAQVTGGLNPTGTVTFQLFDNATCTGTPVFVSSNQPLSGGQAASGSYTPTTTGTFEWVATYNGDNANLTAVSTCGSEPVSILAAAVLGISIPNTGAGLMGALAEGLGLVLAGTGIVVYARRRRRSSER